MSSRNPVFLEAADRIGNTLCRDALWAGSRCNWLGDSMEGVQNSWKVVHRVFGPDLYGGTSGVSLFLARLFALTGDKPHRTAAEGGIGQALSRLEDINPGARIGFYSGLTGIAYALIETGEILDRPDFVAKALKLLEGLLRDDANSQGLDVVSGSAGAIPVLLKIFRAHPNDFLLELATRHAKRLLNTAEKDDTGWSWNTLQIPVERNLTGFSHGTAGIAWALLEIFRHTHEEAFRQAAEQALRYERHWFNSEQQNWPDFRSPSGPQANSHAGPNFMTAWCHGAPGIGLSRLRAYQILGDLILRNEAEIALRTTEKALVQPPGQGNYCLCHGLAGNAELLILASQVLENNDLIQGAEQTGLQGVSIYQKGNLPWPCGVLGGGETPNLMLGLAGIGYFYLRLYDPLKNPSILLVTS
ncbi:MAG: type 2 lanthipeptide synthetase LanM [Terriglobia bacterium]